MPKLLTKTMGLVLITSLACSQTSLAKPGKKQKNPYKTYGFSHPWTTSQLTMKNPYKTCRFLMLLTVS